MCLNKRVLCGCAYASVCCAINSAAVCNLLSYSFTCFSHAHMLFFEAARRAIASVSKRSTAHVPAHTQLARPAHMHLAYSLLSKQVAGGAAAAACERFRARVPACKACGVRPGYARTSAATAVDQARVAGRTSQGGPAAPRRYAAGPPSPSFRVRAYAGVPEVASFSSLVTQQMFPCALLGISFVSPFLFWMLVHVWEGRVQVYAGLRRRRATSCARYAKCPAR